MSKTISIVIPDLLEADLQKAADDLGISRSRYITNILLNWKENRNQTPRCFHWDKETNFCHSIGGNTEDPQCNYLNMQHRCPLYTRGIK